jgi:hypothetical protein
MKVFVSCRYFTVVIVTAVDFYRNEHPVELNASLKFKCEIAILVSNLLDALTAASIKFN